MRLSKDLTIKGICMWSCNELLKSSVCFFSCIEDSPDVSEKYIVLFKANNVSALNKMIADKLDLSTWFIVSEAVINDVNLETFLLLPRFLQRSSSGLISTDEGLMSAIEYLFLKLLHITNSPESSHRKLAILMHLLNNNLVSDKTIRHAFKQLLQKAYVIYDFLLCFFETGKISYTSINQDTELKTRIIQLGIAALDDCLLTKPRSHSLVRLKNIIHIFPEPLLIDIINKAKHDTTIIEELDKAKKRALERPVSYNHFKLFRFHTSQNLQKQWLIQKICTQTNIKDCAPLIQDQLANIWENEMQLEFKL